MKRVKEMKDGNCFKQTSTKEGYQLSEQIRFLIHVINFIILFILYPFICYGMFLVIKGLYLCDLSKLTDSGLISYENIEMMFQGLTNIFLLLILFPLIMLFISYLWECIVKNIKRESVKEHLNEEQSGWEL